MGRGELGLSQPSRGSDLSTLRAKEHDPHQKVVGEVLISMLGTSRNEKSVA
jgi:hypothetical protein